jgi:small-conductance mechanosensitive channel
LIIPNRDVYKNVILVHTHHDTHRLQFDIGIGIGIAYENDAEQATRAIIEAFDRDGIEMPANIVVLHASPSFRAALRRDAQLTPAGNVRPDRSDSNGTQQ